MPVSSILRFWTRFRLLKTPFSREICTAIACNVNVSFLVFLYIVHKSELWSLEWFMQLMWFKQCVQMYNAANLYSLRAFSLSNHFNRKFPDQCIGYWFRIDLLQSWNNFPRCWIAVQCEEPHSDSLNTSCPLHPLHFNVMIVDTIRFPHSQSRWSCTTDTTP